ncbi:putative conjugative transfer TraA domain protein [Orientia tsutsugamushi str. TA716]|uniref:Putative conjugative transfer TraA domain protein n=1 Tax=Orientia tsutsugamushi str. TA716 TaxID=1359175 RepID=A0A0F3NS21_ORITS|nr:putative conjugative transfer TraA domain protein [Orientia tsutsugamushi str. TA716]
MSFDPSEIQFKHGYASTVYKVQGASIKMYMFCIME